MQSASPASLSEYPHSIEAEQALLSSLLKDESLFDKISTIITDESFYHPAHRLIYQAMLKLMNRNVSLSVIAIVHQLEDMNQLKDAGGSEFIQALAAFPLTPQHIQTYAEIVADRSLRRLLMRLAQQIHDESLHPDGKKAKDLLDYYQAQLLSLTHQSSHDGKPLPVTAFIQQTLDRIEENKNNDKSYQGMPSGFHDLDKLTGGFQQGDLIVLAARPSMGKTALSLEFTMSAMYANFPVLFFSLEMPADQIILRLLSMMTGVDHDTLRKGKLHNLQAIAHGIETLMNKPLFIDESSSLTITGIRSRTRLIAKELERSGKKLGAVIIDYLQLIQGSYSSENRVLEVSEISRGLKSLAKELKIPVIALSQLNRGLESRNNKRPVMSDLRESGAIEQDADLIMFIYRDEYYNPTSTEKGLAEVIVAKHRNGPIGTVKLVFTPEKGSFKNYRYE
ncbi:MAG: replicative DNA helicase [Gammaproteobacteria bacterium]|nr:replicative DNA helicase [Gammaproteobacteria bacterium]